MTTRYVANGLVLSCAFKLPGMLPADAHGLPTVSLQRVEADVLGASWSGAGASPWWRGRLGNGQHLTVQPGGAADVLFTYGERAEFLLDRGQRSLLCAPRVDGLDWQRVLLTKVIPNVSVILGYEALHASAVDSPRGAVAILAPSGMGKTTLALALMRCGAPLFCDDILTLAATPGGVLAYPSSPHMNLVQNGASSTAGSVGSTLGVLGDDLWVAADAFAGEPRPVRALCLLERDPALSPKAQRVTPSPLALAPYMLGLSDDYARQRGRFALYAELASSATILRVTCGPADDPGELAGLIESELGLGALGHPVGGRA
jgi:hypothetical protein